MPRVNTSSDLIEVEFTPQELNTAMQMMDKMLSTMYLQNMRVTKLRQILGLEFNEDKEDENRMRQHAYLKGQVDLLKELVEGILDPAPIPEGENQQNQQNSQPPIPT
jgi:hypothetical protein